MEGVGFGVALIVAQPSFMPKITFGNGIERLVRGDEKVSSGTLRR